jgi:hypothetical protein
MAMSSHSRLGAQLAEVSRALNAADLSFALIGGLALSAHRVPRATVDVDLLLAGADTSKADAVLLRLGYQQIYATSNVANYLRGQERVDVLFAVRPAAQRLLAEAKTVESPYGNLPVVSAEGLIGFKVQALVNDPSRRQDVADIQALLKHNRATLDMNEVRGYFRLFNREELLDELLAEMDPAG